MTHPKWCIVQPKYWKKPYKLEREAFAHMFEANIRNDSQKIHYLSSMFPEAYEEFVRMLGGR